MFWKHKIQKVHIIAYSLLPLFVLSGLGLLLVARKISIESLAGKGEYVETVTDDVGGSSQNLLVTNSFCNGNFSDEATLEESGGLDDSKDLCFWLNSGGIFYSEDGVGKTIQGELPEDNPWRILYDKNNPRDTDNGYHPQNIFRLVTRSTWKNFQQDSYFRIVKDNLSASSYRSASNGLLLFNRYQDGNNLYYTGVRVDGFVVIKKKIKGQYFTMAYERVFPGKYDRKKKPNLLPLHQWIGLRSEVSDTENGSVNIKVFMDRNRDGNWKLVAEATDNGKSFGGKVIAESGHAGIRTDFMDVEFDDYRIEKME